MRPKDFPENADSWYDGELNEDDPDPYDAGDLWEDAIENSWYDDHETGGDYGAVIYSEREAPGSLSSKQKARSSPGLFGQALRPRPLTSIDFIWRSQEYLCRVEQSGKGWRALGLVPGYFEDRRLCFSAAIIEIIFVTLSLDESVEAPEGLDHPGLSVRCFDLAYETREFRIQAKRNPASGPEWFLRIGTRNPFLGSSTYNTWLPDQAPFHACQSWDECLSIGVAHLIKTVESGWSYPHTAAVNRRHGPGRYRR